ncbi:helix-turn-helix domain-containing protein [Leucobacter viscericola]|uniref:Helix-turn-helix domain-containing protein n=1 Tax=Leucobacter viscericola TaxID=2714935 RepID=A0A6G7XIC9_9MICO|nr:helix-turn-helix transcriptional regulator [Leucobacter viscericola]QIK64272.1 helix-turn-helix domain-containing protein [Leucobacter viscericola]
MTITDYETDQREALGSFLRAKRQQLNPVDVGLPAGGRRRTPGLRREEVAVLANVGVSWYTRLEQGRDISPSDAVILAIADALRLNGFEREYLMQLSGRQGNQPEPIDCRRHKNVQRILQNLNELPAVCLDRYMNVFATNTLAATLFGCEVGRNSLETFFREQQCSQKFRDHSNTAAMLVSQFRRNAARYPGDPRFANISRELTKSSPHFAQLWSDHTVGAELIFGLRYCDDVHGTVDFDSTTLSVAGENDLRVIVYLPQGDDNAEARWEAIRTSVTQQTALRLAG